MGENGSGKSTLMQILAGVLDHDEGGGNTRRYGRMVSAGATSLRPTDRRRDLLSLRTGVRDGRRGNRRRTAVADRRTRLRAVP
ncbi:ATP-binding cassette domain-containing protein [Halomicrococcus sp. NG-SE-24]|uniref:ATP-binding cassette domain-containing protein n=1 Tax=Halomicrococcus sp. NG-SE-24 TaxID=3436928 RepID=UPI003D962882